MPQPSPASSAVVPASSAIAARYVSWSGWDGSR